MCKNVISNLFSLNYDIKIKCSINSCSFFIIKASWNPCHKLWPDCLKIPSKWYFPFKDSDCVTHANSTLASKRQLCPLDNVAHQILQINTSHLTKTNPNNLLQVQDFNILNSKIAYNKIN